MSWPCCTIWGLPETLHAAAVRRPPYVLVAADHPLQRHKSLAELVDEPLVRGSPAQPRIFPGAVPQLGWSRESGTARSTSSWFAGWWRLHFWLRAAQRSPRQDMSYDGGDRRLDIVDDVPPTPHRWLGHGTDAHPQGCPARHTCLQLLGIKYGHRLLPPINHLRRSSKSANRAGLSSSMDRSGRRRAITATVWPWSD